ncbi:hypothetical protein [Vulcanisaeta sp. JCM 16159]|uniref:hypothetical protein n=1 Tax=Vulcanisaeta sp. JCM 16159 TaxID=1295371 RepID=UPI001FB42F4D|nr:hypothetical protein [Vulcanisaeta sp. JCM 16159]
MRERIAWLKRDLSTLELLALGYSDVSSTYYFTLGIVALNSGPLLPVTMFLGSLSLWLVGLLMPNLVVQYQGPAAPITTSIVNWAIPGALLQVGY